MRALCLGIIFVYLGHRYLFFCAREIEIWRDLDFRSNFPLFFCVCTLSDFRAISPPKTRLYWPSGQKFTWRPSCLKGSLCRKEHTLHCYFSSNRVTSSIQKQKHQQASITVLPLTNISIYLCAPNVAKVIIATIITITDGPPASPLPLLFLDQVL